MKLILAAEQEFAWAFQLTFFFKHKHMHKSGEKKEKFSETKWHLEYPSSE